MFSRNFFMFVFLGLLLILSIGFVSALDEENRLVCCYATDVYMGSSDTCQWATTQESCQPGQPMPTSVCPSYSGNIWSRTIYTAYHFVNLGNAGNCVVGCDVAGGKTACPPTDGGDICCDVGDTCADGYCVSPSGGGGSGPAGITKCTDFDHGAKFKDGVVFDPPGTNNNINTPDLLVASGVRTIYDTDVTVLEYHDFCDGNNITENVCYELGAENETFIREGFSPAVTRKKFSYDCNDVNSSGFFVSGSGTGAVCIDPGYCGCPAGEVWQTDGTCGPPPTVCGSDPMRGPAFNVQSSAGKVAVTDRQGKFFMRGKYNKTSSPPELGFMVKDNGGNVVASIDTEGNLHAADMVVVSTDPLWLEVPEAIFNVKSGETFLMSINELGLVFVGGCFVEDWVPSDEENADIRDK